MLKRIIFYFLYCDGNFQVEILIFKGRKCRMARKKTIISKKFHITLMNYW